MDSSTGVDDSQFTYNNGYFRAAIALLVLQLLAAFGRVFIRAFIVRKFGADDVAMLFTLTLSSAFIALFIALVVMTLGGVGDFQVPPENLVPAIRIVLSILCLYIAATTMLKISLGLLLLRVLVRPWQVKVIYACMAVSTVYGIFFFFFVLFECGNPVNFPRKIAEGQCLSTETINGISYTHAILTAGIDLIFAALPVGLLWHADMRLRSKLSVAGILALGSIGCVATFVRIGYIHLLSSVTLTYFITARPIGILSAAELSIGVTCLCLCTYKPLFHTFFWTETGYYDVEGETGAMQSHLSHVPMHRYSRSQRSHARASRTRDSLAVTEPAQVPPQVPQQKHSIHGDTLQPAYPPNWPMGHPTSDEDIETETISPSSPRGLKNQSF